MRGSWGDTVAVDTKARSLSARYSAHVTSAEWQWLIVVASALSLLTVLPLLWVALRGTPGWTFMGVLHNHLDGATYLSKMMLGSRGDWLVYFQHTPELHGGAFIQVIYLLLGHLANFIGLSNSVMFHVARLGASVFMYISLYQLGAMIWTHVRARRIFFGITALGSGIGWLLAPLTGITLFPDFALLPEAYLLFSSYMNVHFPLTLACLCWLAGLLVFGLRPGAGDDPTTDQVWPLVGLLSIALAFLYPQSLIPIGGASVLFVGIQCIEERRFNWRALRLAAALVLPVVPIAVYLASLIAYNPAMAEWNRQNVTESPDIWIMLVGFVFPLAVALPGISRAVRRFEADGDRLFLLWLICMLIAIYLPTNIQRRFAVGMMIPIGYFATRAIEEFWIHLVGRRWRRWLYALFFPLIAVSPLLMLILPALPAMTGTPASAQGIYLQSDYTDAFAWLRQRTNDATVILASPVVSLWVPSWTGGKVVYGHPYETLNAETKQAQVISWYRSEPEVDCSEIIASYHVRYVLLGPQERALGATSCVDGLRELASFGTVAVYAP